jgi:hypothetical protein
MSPKVYTYNVGVPWVYIYMFVLINNCTVAGNILWAKDSMICMSI